MALLHFTSGTTGTPKGAVHVHEAVVSHHATGRIALDLHPDDVFWCTADPGWVTGTSYGIIAPLVHGVTSIVDEGDFDAERWYATLEAEAVTVWYTAPTALRMLMQAGAERGQGARSQPPPVRRQRRRAAQPRGGGMGRGGARCAHPRQLVADRDGRDHDRQLRFDGHPAGLDGTAACRGRGGDPRCSDEHGTVVVGTDGAAQEVASTARRASWPFARGGPRCSVATSGDTERYRACFAGGWYLSGDLARRDDDGYFWFVGRADDVIKSAGHLIGPFEVESTLMEHPAVVEAGVIGKPDPVAGELVKAFVALRPGFDPSDELRLELIGLRAQAPRRGGGAPGDRIRPAPAPYPQREDHASAAQGARAGAARG